MINHISIGVHDTEKVANVLAEIWNGYAFPFPPSPNSYVVFADDGKGTTVEVTPINVELIPGKELPVEENYDLSFPTGEFEATFQIGDNSPQFVPVHLAINSPLSAEEIKEIGRREGWRVLTANRGGGIIQLIEVWVENRFMFEVFTPEMTARYVEIMKPENWANFLQIPFPPKPAVTTDLSLVG